MTGKNVCWIINYNNKCSTKFKFKFTLIIYLKTLCESHPKVREKSSKFNMNKVLSVL